MRECIFKKQVRIVIQSPIETQVPIVLLGLSDKAQGVRGLSIGSRHDISSAKKLIQGYVLALLKR